jgi:predicted Zn-dependent peptidase
LCYSIFSFASAYADTGQLGVYAGTDPEDLGELMRVVADETRALIDDPDEDELARSRAQLKASLFMGLESCSAVCEDNARQLLCFGRRVPTEEIVARIDAVDTARVRRLGRGLLERKGLTMAAVGPLEELPAVDLTALAA